MATEISINGMVVVTRMETKLEKGDPKGLSFIVELDYAGVTNDDLLKWANANRIIAIQNALRAAGRECGRDEFIRLSKEKIVRRAVNAGNVFVSVDKTEKALQQKLATMTKAERLAELQRYMAMVEALDEDNEDNEDAVHDEPVMTKIRKKS